MYSNREIVHHSTPLKKRYLCFLDHDPDLSWVLFSNLEKTAFFGMVHDRFSASQRVAVLQAMDNVTPNRTLMSFEDCTFLNPPLFA